MPSVHCLPSRKTIDVSPGTELLDAIRKAGIDIDLPCGGKGTCGKCLVRIASGQVDSDSLGLLSAESVSQGHVLACRSRVTESPVTVEIPEQLSGEAGKFADTDETYLVRPDLLPSPADIDPLAVKLRVTVPPPQLEGGLSDLDRLTRAMLSACSNLKSGTSNLKSELSNLKSGIPDFTCSLSALRALADALRSADGAVTVTLTREASRIHIIRIEPGDTTARQFGLAVDVGTTTVAVQLIDLITGRILATRTDYNAQGVCGLDVISRINYARRPERREELRTRILDTINHLLRRVCEDCAVDPHELCNAAISGNTTMTHLLLGLNPEYIRLHPYTPTILHAPQLPAAEVGIDIHPDAPIAFSPAVGSYVGGDITAGILCTDLAADSDRLSLFIDIGTNGELVIGNREFLMTCACSAGPAFEGAGIECGMRAARGAIDNVEIDPATGLPHCSIIGSIRPRGICGSGMIDLLANLFLTGWIDPAGRLDRTRPCAAIRIEGKRARYILASETESDTGRPISVSELDIENIIRAKAAIYSACALMMRQLDMLFTDLANVFIAGGFGRSLNLEQAIAIGLLPDIPRERFHYIGNASLTGSYMLTLSQRFRRRQLDLAGRMTYIELNTDPAYMDQYTGALFLPHTDPAQFPSVSVGSASADRLLSSTTNDRSAEADPTADLPTHQEQAETKVIERAAAVLTGVDLPSRCAALGLNPPNPDSSLTIRVFGQDLRFNPPSYSATIGRTGEPAALVDRLLAVRYLLCDVPVAPTGQIISFRELSGGQFYWQPFRSRSLLPLLKRIGNDLDLLRAHLGRFAWQPLEMGDLGARIHVLGNIDVLLVYHRGDEEMSPAADLLFDACIKRVYNAEDVAAIASRICLGLL